MNENPSNRLKLADGEPYVGRLAGVSMNENPSNRLKPYACYLKL